MAIRRIVTVCIALANASIILAQTQPKFERKPHIPAVDGTPASGLEWRFQLVERLLTLPDQVQVGAVQLHGMGDEAAVDLLKLLSKKESFSVAEQQAALEIIHTAFEWPDSIIDPANKKPMATQLLLTQMYATTNNFFIRERIDKERTALKPLLVPAGASSSK